MLPVGTVTFLFTDIEGSTGLWEQEPERMRLALVRHECILRESIEFRSGYVFKTVGDGFCAAFSTALDALAAALDGQRRLAGENTEQTTIKVRIGLHTGSAESRDGDYFGPSLNRVARLMAAGHGGQILLSLATEELIRDDLALKALGPGVSLRFLGAHRLRDLTHPEQIYQLEAQDLPADFPPLHTLSARPNNLPIQPTPLLGREKEVATLCEMLRRPALRLITLMGMGGMGKSRLSVQVAAELLDDFSDGAFFVTLAPLRDSGMVLSAIIQALNIQVSAGQTPLQGLLRFLRAKHLLLVLDNFEHVTDAAPLVADLLAACPELKVLVTSRVALHLRGEQEYAVPPLALPCRKPAPPLAALPQYASVELFRVRAQAVKADFALTDENAPAVAEICWRLDGLPLAIELAAARVKILTPAALLTRLEHRLNLLTGGPRDLPARHQTLRNAIAWSYDLLDETEQKLLRSLAVFAGGCTLEAAEAVCSPSGSLGIDVFDGLSSLIDKSLLRQTEDGAGEPRFVLLETVRAFACEQLVQRGEMEMLESCHADYYHRCLEMEKGRKDLGNHTITFRDRIGHFLGKERDNLLASLHWLAAHDPQEAVGMGVSLSYNFASHEVFSCLEHALERSEIVPAALRIAALIQLVGISRSTMALSPAAEKVRLKQALQIAIESNDDHRSAVSRYHLAVWEWYQGHFDAARSGFLECTAIFVELKDHYYAANGKLWAGRSCFDMGDYTAAVKMLEDVLIECRTYNLEIVAMDTHIHLGVLHFAMGDDVRATERFDEVAPMGGGTNASGWLSRIWQRRGADEKSKALAQQTLTQLEQDSNKREIMYLLYHLANDALDQAKPALAEEWLTQAWPRLLAWGDGDRYAHFLLQTAGRQAAAHSEPERAARLSGAAETARAIPDCIVLPVWITCYNFDCQPENSKYAAAWAEGRSLTTENAMRLAISKEEKS